MIRVLIWGTGKSSDAFVSLFGESFDLKGFIETNPKSEIHNGHSVYPSDKISSLTYDYILVVNSHYDEIVSECKKQDIDLKKVVSVFERKIGIVDSKEKNYDFINWNPSQKWFYWRDLLFCTDDLIFFCNMIRERDFSKWWSDYDNNVLLSLSNHVFNNLKQIIVSDFSKYFNKQNSVLDIGCSNGIVDELIAGYCKEIDAYDYSNASIEKAKKVRTKKGLLILIISKLMQKRW